MASCHIQVAVISEYDLKNDDPEKLIAQDPLGTGRRQKEYCSISDTG